MTLLYIYAIVLVLLLPVNLIGRAMMHELGAESRAEANMLTLLTVLWPVALVVMAVRWKGVSDD